MAHILSIMLANLKKYYASAITNNSREAGFVARHKSTKESVAHNDDTLVGVYDGSAHGVSTTREAILFLGI